jgi:hypothetical protein
VANLGIEELPFSQQRRHTALGLGRHGWYDTAKKFGTETGRRAARQEMIATTKQPHIALLDWLFTKYTDAQRNTQKVKTARVMNTKRIV